MTVAGARPSAAVTVRVRPRPRFCLPHLISTLTQSPSEFRLVDHHEDTPTKNKGDECYVKLICIDWFLQI